MKPRRKIIGKEKNNVTASGLGFDIPIAYSPKWPNQRIQGASQEESPEIP
jgi:hypothetical protein